MAFILSILRQVGKQSLMVLNVIFQPLNKPFCALLLRLQRALIVRLVLRVNWWQVLEEVEVSSVARDDSERLM